MFVHAASFSVQSAWAMVLPTCLLGTVTYIMTISVGFRADSVVGSLASCCDDGGLGGGEEVAIVEKLLLRGLLFFQTFVLLVKLLLLIVVAEKERNVVRLGVVVRARAVDEMLVIEEQQGRRVCIRKHKRSIQFIPLLEST